MPKSKPEQLYVRGSRGGYNPKARRWMSADGKLAKKSTVLAADSTVFGQGAVTALRFPSPISSALDRLEVNLSNLSEVNDPAAPSGLANVLRAALNLSDKPNEKRPADLMPHEISTKMRLSQFFYNSQGDAAQAVDTPVDLLSREIVVDCPDAALGKDLQDLIRESGIYRILPELWRGVREFGQMYPLEAWSGGKVTVYPLDPRAVNVGYNFSIGLGSDVYGEKSWSKDLVESRMPPALYQDLFHNWNTLSLPWSSRFPIPGNLVRPIQDKAYSFDRYAMPMLSRVFRDLTSIAVHEDAVRVVTEGFRYQLWTFVLGDAEHQPTPLEVTTLQAVIGGIAGERTGSLVWKAPLKIEIHAPNGLDQLIGTDYLRTLTLNLYRKLGVLSRAVSGEAPGSMGGAGGGGGNADLEVRLYLERARFQSNQILDWVSYICEKWARATSKKVSDIKGTTYRFTPSSLEAEALIKNIFGPMYRDGALDHANYVKAAGLNPAAIVAAKKAEKSDRDSGLFDPPATFAQKVVGADGATVGQDKTTAQTEPQGRPPADTVQRNDNGNGQNRVAASDMTPHITINQPMTFNIPEQQAPVNNVNVAAPNVAMPEQVINVIAPPITVQAAEQPNIIVNIPPFEMPTITIPPSQVTVSPANVQVDVHVPEQPAPIVNVAAAEVHVPEQLAPVVNIEAAQINVPQQPAPNVTVNVPQQNPPTVNVAAAQVHVPQQSAPVVNVVVPETEEIIEVTDRNLDGSMKRATKTRRRKAG